ncbi:cytochrome P450 72A397-like [Zingiber officinale]|uniref:Cytochrome P450 n=1 Tax=Zingiber officinale TaxID=94328 RepID=A0A8J5F981_ZINOF|nr:cytochrome P450 72A397-like [Zingiber officinale]KAG6482620.1 hypothetical protein ZIOFF_059253 [Zingiber officinale]
MSLVACSWSAAVWAAAGLLAASAAVAFNWAWWRPRRLERALRAQGLRGTPYRFLHGDLPEEGRLNADALSKPMPLSHDVAARAVPFLHRAMSEFGSTSFSWYGTTPRITVTDPDSINEIFLDKFGRFGRFGNVHPIGRFLSTGLISYEGAKWIKHRRILNPAFHAEKLKRMLPAFSACCSDLVSRWEGLIGSEDYCELDVWPQLQHFTGDVISRAAFGSNYEEGRRIFQLQSQIADLVINAIQTVYIPGSRFLPTPMNNKIKAIDGEIGMLLKDILKKREEALKMGEASSDDLLGLLMESNMKQYREHGNKDVGMTIEEVTAECKLFYFAGQETTSVLLTWTMVVLSMHPDWQTKAREEVLQVFGQRKPELDGLNHLKIVTMILYEVLRLYPPLPLMRRRTNKTIKIGNIICPPGSLLALPVISIHHDPNFWGNTANEFKPERFAEGIANASKDQVAFFPFSGGPRVCIGQNFALLEAKMFLSMILQRFSFELSPAYAHAPRLIVTLQPQYGAPLRLHKL